MAKPDTFVTSMTGDGTYMFTIPSTVHWMARRYNTPFLQVIFNNGGWRAPRYSAVGVHPNGLASQGDDIGSGIGEIIKGSCYLLVPVEQRRIQPLSQKPLPSADTVRHGRRTAGQVLYLPYFFDASQPVVFGIAVQAVVFRTAHRVLFGILRYYQPAQPVIPEIAPARIRRLLRHHLVQGVVPVLRQ